MVQAETASTLDARPVGARPVAASSAAGTPAANVDALAVMRAGRPALWFVLLMVLGAATCALCANRFGAHVEYELPHYAEIARNLAEGRGFVTRIALPSSLATYVAEGHVLPPWPVLDRFFGLPLLASFFVRLSIEPVAAVLLVEALSAGLLLASTCFAAFSLGGRRAALFALAVLLINPLVVHRWAGGGLADLPFAALVGSLIYVLALQPSVPRMWWLAGALAGAALTVRYNFGIWLPSCVAFLAWRTPSARLRSVGSAILGAVLVVVSALALTMLNSMQFPRYVVGTWNLVAEVATSLDPWGQFRVWHANDAFQAGLGAIAIKGARNLGSLFTGGWDLFCAPLVVGLALLGAARARSRPLVVFTLALLIPHLALMVFTRAEPGLESVWKDRYHAWLVLPMFALAAAAVARIDGRRGAALAVIVSGLTAWGYTPYFGALPRLDMQSYFARETLEKLQADNPESVIVSNTAFAIGLSFRVGAVDFPMDDASVDALLKAAPVALFIVDTDMALLTMPAFVRRELDRDLLVGFGERHGLTRRTVFYKPDGTLAGLVLAPQLRAAQGESAPHPPAPKI